MDIFFLPKSYKIASAFQAPQDYKINLCKFLNGKLLQKQNIFRFYIIHGSLTQITQCVQNICGKELWFIK